MSRRRSIPLVVAVFLLAPVLWGAFVLHVPDPSRAFLPFGVSAECAIVITDDTDGFQFETTDPVYDLLDSLGVCVTKTIWVFDPPNRDPERYGLSWANATYRRWVHEKIERGHEITLHSATSGHDPRAVTLAAYDTLHALLGDYPRLEIFHTNNREALYWGAKRIPNPVLSRLYALRSDAHFEGDEPESEYYWLDVARDRVRYLRTYTSNDTDTWAINPSMPYEDERTPGAPLWFASSNGRTGEEFVTLLSAENVEALKRANGVSVVYTHFAADFTRPGPDRRRVRGDVRETLTRCATDPTVAFVPAGDMLDRMRLAQLVKRGLAAGERTIRVPAVLEGQEMHVSVRAEEGRRSSPHGSTRRDAASSGPRTRRCSRIPCASVGGSDGAW